MDKKTYQQEYYKKNREKLLRYHREYYQRKKVQMKQKRLNLKVPEPIPTRKRKRYLYHLTNVNLISSSFTIYLCCPKASILQWEEFRLKGARMGGGKPGKGRGVAEGQFGAPEGACERHRNSGTLGGK